MDASRHKNLISVSFFLLLQVFTNYILCIPKSLFSMKAVSAETVKFVRKSAKLMLFCFPPYVATYCCNVLCTSQRRLPIYILYVLQAWRIKAKKGKGRKSSRTMLLRYSIPQASVFCFTAARVLQVSPTSEKTEKANGRQSIKRDRRWKLQRGGQISDVDSAKRLLTSSLMVRASDYQCQSCNSPVLSSIP